MPSIEELADQLKRFEEKYKLAMLQVDKRIAMVESSADKALDEAESIDETRVKALQKETDNVKKEKEREMKEIAALIESMDVDSMKKSMDEMKGEMAKLREQVDEKVRETETMQHQLLMLQQSVPRDDLVTLQREFSLLLDRMDRVQKEFSAMKKSFLMMRVMQPIVME
ncbi:MAG TPA: hypothetical protein VJH90_03270 [archaeon]|nr:hypothetical protein [archaeon]